MFPKLNYSDPNKCLRILRIFFFNCHAVFEVQPREHIQKNAIVM